MLALYRSGRQADALEVYRDARRTLSVELGLEPGPRLRELEQAVLQQDPGLDAPETAIAVDTKRRRGAVLLATGGALLLAVVAAIAVALALSGCNKETAAPAPATAAASPPYRGRRTCTRRR